jgi:hypothetical protein
MSLGCEEGISAELVRRYFYSREEGAAEEVPPGFWAHLERCPSCGYFWQLAMESEPETRERYQRQMADLLAATREPVVVGEELIQALQPERMSSYSNAETDLSSLRSLLKDLSLQSSGEARNKARQRRVLEAELTHTERERATAVRQEFLQLNGDANEAAGMPRSVDLTYHFPLDDAVLMMKLILRDRINSEEEIADVFSFPGINRVVYHPAEPDSRQRVGVPLRSTQK